VDAVLSFDERFLVPVDFLRVEIIGVSEVIIDVTQVSDLDIKK